MKTCPTIAKLFLLLMAAFPILGVMIAEAQKAKGEVIDYSIFGRKGAKARKARLKIPEKHYDPNTIVFVDALWMRVHEADCPSLLLKEHKKRMTLEAADKAGYRIGESGQSGREHCCFHGYRLKYPNAEIPENALGTVQILKSGEPKWHLAGCHRFSPQRDHARMTMKEGKAAGARICDHCIERGPSIAAEYEKAWLKEKPVEDFVRPAGREAKPYSPDTLPSAAELGLFVQEVLGNEKGEAREFRFSDPIATVENFTQQRFFFGGYNLQKAYRATGDKRLLDRILREARHYHELSVNYLSAAQVKARDPEGMAYLYEMAAWARITLQLARKDPSQVSRGEIAEAEAFLKSIVAVLKPTCEEYETLDPAMGIPQQLADDFRSRAWNRAMNGIGTIGLATAALEDLQVLKKTREYERTIARYRKVIEEYLKNFKKGGCFFTEADGKQYFYYPYGTSDKGKVVDGFKLFNGPEDQGHYSHTVQGLYLLYEAVPELGVDDKFMTAVANAVYHNSMTKKHGSIQCPSADQKRPKSRKPYGAARERFYLLEAFKDGVIDGQCVTLNAGKREAVTSDYGQRLETLHSHYLKALRKDRTLVHLGEVK